MRSSLAHLPDKKQRELARVVEILLEEFEDALCGGSAYFKKKGRILKIILFGSYARGDWVDEPHTMKGYRSDYDLLIVVNNRKLTDFAAYWSTARERLLRDRGVKTPTSFIVHSRREVNMALREGQYFYSDIRREGIVLYELDDEPLAEPKLLTAKQAYSIAQEYFLERLPAALEFQATSEFASEHGWIKRSAFLLHQSLESLYSTVLLTLTNYSPPSHNLQFLRALAEDQDRRLTEIWPRDQRRYVAWFNTLNEAYVKARYSKHYDISVEALAWLSDRTAELHNLVEQICQEHLAKLQQAAS
ncbi:HEPN domain-containing protein [Pseudaminobacter arsenicus]|uniref:HEPN domain-containing protein n=1 Tax=Borborobacter arsenicus TaxID=1851146 RepID=A0A432UYW4_9HYPH|nr:nucleotidyltransferase and HEPN domain-containing protein [Pseudaminobacter arsenicus]RUM95127.1 HEPN domain-containing protein [Pseudaminobacter arsenicus]